MTQNIASAIDAWLDHEAIPFAGDDFDAAVDRLMAILGDQIGVLGIGEPLHGGDEFVTLRNRLFQRLVAAHGFSAITIETNDIRAERVDAYTKGHGTSYDEIVDDGFTAGIGHWLANRELVEWMRHYNADPANVTKLNLYGTLASDQETTRSPRHTLEAAIAFLATLDPAAAAAYRARVEPLLGPDADWEESATRIMQDIAAQVLAGPTSSVAAGHNIGLSPRADGLRLAIDDLLLELTTRRPELIAASTADAHAQAVRHLTVARNLLAMHAAIARRDSLDDMVSMRDAMAADHLASIVERERGRGRVLVFLHSAHLQRSKVKLPWYEFWPTGAHLDRMLGDRFAVIGGALGSSEQNFIGAPEPGSIEARLAARRGSSFVPTRRGRHLPACTLPERSASTSPYVPYSPLTRQIVRDIDAVAYLDTVTYTRGAPALPG